MTNLSELSLDISYRSDEGNVVRDFYVPCLMRAAIYRRAAGYFTSHGLALAAKGIAHLIRAGGRMELVVSPFLSEPDIAAMSEGYRSREEMLTEVASRSLPEPRDELERNRLAALAWLISIGALDVKLAFRIDAASGRVRKGLYHEKIGIFSDAHGNHVAFTGSQNETEGGLVDNFESIDVYCSWTDAQQRVARKLKAFDQLWENTTKGLVVIDFNEVSGEVLSRFKTKAPPDFDDETIDVPASSISSRRTSSEPHIPSSIALRNYQERAINGWFKNNGVGLLEMATGTGKTITALAAVTKLYEKIGLQAVIIVCPYKHLVDQWRQECERFGAEPLVAYESRREWFDMLTVRLSNLHRDPKAFLCVITTNATFASEAFQHRVAYFPTRTCFVADEVHNLGARTLSSLLPREIGLRLGLSATPERWFDPEGTASLAAYFGSVIEPRLGLKEAISLQALTPYRYHPILIELTDQERQSYLELSTRIARVYSATDGGTEDPALSALLIKRARLVGTAANKLVALRQLARQYAARSHMLFYCGDGSVEVDEDDSSVRRQVDEVVRILGSEIGLRVDKYTSETHLADRDRLRRAVDSGELQGLVAIRCLDEGVDIPSVRVAVILASSTNPRQFVQRRGRVLRLYPGKEAAEIHDMIVVPPEESVAIGAERSLLKRELTRFAEFADIALNAGQARQVVLGLQKKFGLMDL